MFAWAAAKLGIPAAAGLLKYAAIAAAALVAFLVIRGAIHDWEDAIAAAARAPLEAQRDQAIRTAAQNAAAVARMQADAEASAKIAADTRAHLAATAQENDALKRKLAELAAAPGGDAPMTPALAEALRAWRATARRPAR